MKSTFKMLVFAVLFLGLVTPNQTKADSVGPVWYLVQVTKGVSNEVTNVAPIQKKQVREVQLETDSTDTVAAAVSKVQEKLADLDWTEPSGMSLGKVVQAGGIPTQMEIYGFGYGVYYFEYQNNGFERRMSGKVFAETIAYFRQQHQNLVNPSITMNMSFGYFVIFERR